MRFRTVANYKLFKWLIGTAVVAWDTSRIRSGVRPLPAASHQVLFNFLLRQDVAAEYFSPEAGENVLFKASSSALSMHTAPFMCIDNE